MIVKQFGKLNGLPKIGEYKSIIPFFASQQYADYLETVKNYRTIWFCGFLNEELVYIIPFAYRKKYIFSYGMFLTATINIKINLDDDAERDFLYSVIKVIKEKKLCDWIAQPPNWALFRVVPSNSIFCEFGTYKINLAETNENDIYNNFDRNTRYEIRKAIKNKIIIKKGFENLDDCIKIFNAANKKSNFNYPHKDEIEKLIGFFPENISLYIGYHNNVPQTCNIILFDNSSSYGLYSATNSDRLYGANHLLFWEMIKDVKMGGKKYFDFVGARINPAPGSKQEKIQLFKKHFGGTLVQGFLWKIPISKIKYYFFRITVRTLYFIKFKRYKGDIIDQEIKRLMIND